MKIILTSLICFVFINCSSASNRIIHAKDHASIQLNIVDVDPTTGRMLDTCKTYAICGKFKFWRWRVELDLIQYLLALSQSYQTWLLIKSYYRNHSQNGRVRWLLGSFGQKRWSSVQVSSFNITSNEILELINLFFLGTIKYVFLNISLF